MSTTEMDAGLREALEALRDFREFAINNAMQWRLGANHHNPMWLRVAGILDRYGMNDTIPKNTFRCDVGQSENK